MTNIVGDQNRRGAAKSQRKLWDVKSGQFTIILNGTENCVPKPYCLRSKDVQQLEQLQRSVMKRIQCLPINTATSAAYGLLGIRPIQQELDLRKLTLLGNILLHKDTLEFEIAQRQLAVKSIDSNSWFADCNRLPYKYSLPNIYHVIEHIESQEGWRVLVKSILTLM